MKITIERETLERAMERMERARAILTGNNPRPECNWGMLDTSDLRAALAAQPAEAQQEPVAPTLPPWWFEFIVAVCELPDRNSPEGEPDAMVATEDELASCALAAIERTPPDECVAALKSRLQAIGDLAASCRTGPGLREAMEEIERIAAAQPAEAQRQTLMGWVCTDLDGRAGIGFTKEQAKRQAGEHCNEYIPVFDNGAQPTPAAVPPDEQVQELLGAAQRMTERVRVLREALETIITWNRDHATAQYGNPDKAESWACIVKARAALEAAK